MMPINKSPDSPQVYVRKSNIKPAIKGRALLPHLQKILDEELSVTQVEQRNLTFKPVLCKDGHFRIMPNSVMDK